MTILNRTKKAHLRDGTVIDGRDVSELREMCRRFNVGSAVKRAAIGGDQEQGFESSFASLAYAYIQDKAPGLLDYLIGFQLVDRNDDNTKAVGIFGFKVGPQWIYAPVFFLNGDLKGHELLYLKSQDTFVPMKENWINYTINKRPHILGEGTPETLDQLGGLRPDIQSLSQPPENGKFAGVLPKIKSWAKESGLLPRLGSWATQNPSELYPGLSDRLDFSRFVASDFRFAKLARAVGQAYPGTKEAMDAFYGPSMLRSALLEIKEAVSRLPSDILGQGNDRKAAPRLQKNSVLKKSVADKPKKVEVFTSDLITKNRPPSDEAEAKKLLRQGYLIRDHRDGEEVSVVYNTQIPMSLVNPDQTGIYEILVKPGGFEKCLVVHQPYGENGRYGFCTVVLLAGGNNKSHSNFHPTKVFIRQDDQSVKSETSEYRKWFNSLSENKSLTKGAYYLVVSSSGQGTCVFSVSEDLGDGCYEVYWHDRGGDARPDYIDHGYSHGYARPNILGEPGNDVIYFNQREGSGYRPLGGKLYLPAESRVIQVEDAPRCRKCEKSESDCICDYFRGDHSRRSDPIKPGSLADIQLQLLQKNASTVLADSAPGSGLSELKIWTDHSEVVVNRQRMSKMAGLFHLVVGHGLREGVAKRLIKEAERARGGGKRWYIKHAAPYMGEIGPYAAGEGMGAPVDGSANITTNSAYSNVPIQEFDPGQFSEVPGMNARQTDPSVYDPMQNIDPASQQVAQQAYQNNQKEVFDTAMISNMLKAVREDSLVDRYLGDLTKALDRLGRILFMFYWHNEEFMDQYGKQDLPELEDTLRNAFEVLGDLVLFLKQKTVEPMAYGEPDLDNSARN